MFSLKTIKERLLSFVYAWRGLVFLFLKEDSFKYQLFFSICFIIAGFYFQISTSEWLAQLLIIAVVLSMEGLNSSVEQLSDYVQPKHDNAIGKIKDIAAGAVLVFGIFAFVIMLIIYIPYFVNIFD